MNINFKKFIFGLIIFLGFVLVCQIFRNNYQKDIIPLRVNFLDVDQGDAILINYLEEYQILIDGGPKKDLLLSKLVEEMPWGDKNIEIVVLTHPDKDHLSGLAEVMDYYTVGLFLWNGQKAETEIFKNLEEKLDSYSIKKQIIGEGSKFNIGKYLNFSFFNPDVLIEEDKDRNDQSIVFRMDYGENSFLFTGDAEESSEADMIYDEEDVDTDYLKVGHHGSKNSTSEKLLESVTPQYAIISAGKNNRYNHPNKETLERLEKVNAQVLRTDERGDIEITCRNLEEKCRILE